MVRDYFAFESQPPIYYDYGNNITNEAGHVYVNGQAVGSDEAYYEQAYQLAKNGAETEPPADAHWLPLGVFALTKSEHLSSNLVLQLAINKQGIVRGNYTNTMTNHTEVVHGALDKQTQRVAFTVGLVKSTIVETSLANLTTDDAPALMHVGKNQAEPWLLIRLKTEAQRTTGTLVNPD